MKSSDKKSAKKAQTQSTPQPKKKTRRKQSTRRAINAQSLTPYGLLTYRNDEITYFLVRPTNISVLSETALKSKVDAMVTVLKSLPDVELLCLNSRESFANNTRFLDERIAAEDNPYLTDLLEKDKAHLSSVQLQTATAREFAVAVRLSMLKEKEKYPYLTRVENLIAKQGFEVRRADVDDVKRLMAVYFVQDFTSEHYDDYDGERWVTWRQEDGAADKKAPSDALEEDSIKEFLDMASPSILHFYAEHFICDNTYRCVWALRGYPAATSEQALLQHLGEKAGVTVHIYTRRVNSIDERRLMHNAEKSNRLKAGNTSNMQDVVAAESNLQDVAAVLTMAHRNKEPFLHTAVYLEMVAKDLDELKELQDEVASELNSTKMNMDRLLLRQKEGFQSVMPSGWNVFGDQYERVLPATSVANLYPMCYSGKTDPRGFLLGRDKYGSNIIIDMDRRTEDRTTASCLILGNSGQGKSHLLKLLIINVLESGKNVILFDVEDEYRDLTDRLGGCYVDLMTGEYKINLLEPKLWNVDESDDASAPKAFRGSSALAQHISFLRDVLRIYKNLSEQELDTAELMLVKLYEKFDINADTNLSTLTSTDYPIMEDFQNLLEAEYYAYDDGEKKLFTASQLQAVCLAMHSMCKGADSVLFNGHTNITSSRILTFGMKGLMNASRNTKDAMLFNVLSYMSNALLTKGNTVAGIDELYVYLSNPTAIEYIRNAMKRVRKKESALILASQNIDDFLIPGVAEMTKPLFSIPTYQFLFHPGAIDGRAFMDALQLEPCEYEVIKSCSKGMCLFKCGSERYNLVVKTPEHKLRYYGKAGGR